MRERMTDEDLLDIKERVEKARGNPLTDFDVLKAQDRLSHIDAPELIAEVEHARSEIRRQDALIDELYSIALWVTCRMPSPYYKNYVYDMIDKATGTESERV